MTLRQILTHPWVNENNCVKYYLNPTWTNKAVRSYGLDTNFCYVCTVTWPWRYDHRSRSWHTLGLWTTVWSIVQIQVTSEKLWPGHGFWLFAVWPWPWRYDLGSRSWHIFRDNSGWLQQWENLSYLDNSMREFNRIHRKYSLRVLNSMRFLWKVWENLSISQPKIIPASLVMENNCVKYSNPTRQFEVMARTEFWLCVHCDLDLGDMTLVQGHDTTLVQGHNTPLVHGQVCEILSRSNEGVRSYGPDNMWTDRQGDSYIPLQTLFARGIINSFKQEARGPYIAYLRNGTISKTAFRFFMYGSQRSKSRSYVQKF